MEGRAREAEEGSAASTLSRGETLPGETEPKEEEDEEDEEEGVTVVFRLGRKCAKRAPSIKSNPKLLPDDDAYIYRHNGGLTLIGERTHGLKTGCAHGTEVIIGLFRCARGCYPIRFDSSHLKRKKEM